MAAAMGRPVRKFTLKPGQATAKILTDASPTGLGAILVLNGKVTKALVSPVTRRCLRPPL